jgi:enamine deaminase RidA (YjgF/YER057c/UK114 family)
VKKSDVIVPKGMEMAYDGFHFAPALKTGRWLRCSGQLGTDEKFAAIPEPEAQFAQAFENVKRVLAAAKLDFSDVVEMTTFHVGLQQHLGTFIAVKDRYLAAPYPAWTAIGIVELAVPGALVEIRVTARLRDRRTAKGKPAKRGGKAAAKRRRG